MTNRTFDVGDIKNRAAGRWRDIFTSIGGIDQAILDGQHHPCPKCGGHDRFRFIDPNDGCLFCNQCFSEGNGDGISGLRWLTGDDFPTTCEKLADFLQATPANKQKPESHPNRIADPAKLLAFRPWDDKTERIARKWCEYKKGITVEAIKAAGGRIATFRRDYTVVAIPGYGAELDNANPTSWTVFNAEPPIEGKPNSGMLPQFTKNEESGEWEISDWKKVLLTHGSKKGLIGLHGLQRIESAENVVIVEGPTDLLAMSSSMTERERESTAVVSSSNGASCRLDSWMVHLMAGKNVTVVYDCDSAGKTGAAKHFHSLKQKIASVRVLKLPYPNGSKAIFGITSMREIRLPT